MLKDPMFFKFKINQYAVICLVALLLNSCNSDAVKNYENSGHAISLNRSKDLYINYNTKLKPAVEKEQKEIIKRKSDIYNGTEYVLLSIQQLENYLKFLKEVEKQNEGKSNPDKEITGIAIFLGANNENETLKTKPKFSHKIKNYDEMIVANDRVVGDIRNRMTVFLAPTYRDNANDANYNNEFERHIPFYISNAKTKDKKYKGDYSKLIDYLRIPQRQQMQTGTPPESTDRSLNADEFGSMPPKD